MKKLQAVQHPGNCLISTAERSSSTSTCVVLAAFNVMQVVPAFTIGL